MRYDAAIIGAGANGLTAAAVLARAGLKTVVIERGAAPAAAWSPTHSIPAFPPRLSPTGCRRFLPKLPPLLALDTPLLVEDCRRIFASGATPRWREIFAEARSPIAVILLARLRRALAPIEPAHAWPGQDLAARPLADWPASNRWALIGRAIDPDLAGSALALLALAGVEPVKGGLGALGEAFLPPPRRPPNCGWGRRPAKSSNPPVAGSAGVLLADGSRIAADAVISTLDLKHSLLSLFPWTALTPRCAAGGPFPHGPAARRGCSWPERPRNAAAPVLLAGDARRAPLPPWRGARRSRRC